MVRSGSRSRQTVVTEAPDDARLLLVGQVLVADDCTPHLHAVVDLANDLSHLMALTFELETLEAGACLVNNLKHRFPTLICNRWRKEDQGKATRHAKHGPQADLSSANPSLFLLHCSIQLYSRFALVMMQSATASMEMLVALGCQDQGR